MPKSKSTAKVEALLNSLAEPHRKMRAVVAQELLSQNLKHSTLDHVEMEIASALCFYQFGELTEAKNCVMRVGAMLRLLPETVSKMPAVFEAWRSYMGAFTADKVETIVSELQSISPRLSSARQELYGPAAVMMHAVFLIQTVQSHLPAKPDGSSEETDTLCSNLETLMEALSTGVIDLGANAIHLFPKAEEALEQCAEALALVDSCLGEALDQADLDVVKQRLQSALAALAPRLN